MEMDCQGGKQVKKGLEHCSTWNESRDESLARKKEFCVFNKIRLLAR